MFSRLNRNHIFSADLTKLGVIQYIPAEIAVLYTLLEVEFDPLKLCVRVKHSLDSVETFATAKDPKLMQYIESLQAVSIVRLLKQLSQVYAGVVVCRSGGMTEGCW